MASNFIAYSVIKKKPRPIWRTPDFNPNQNQAVDIPKFKVSNPRGLSQEQLQALESIPYWAIPNNLNIDAYGSLGINLGSAGTFSEEKPNNVEWWDKEANTLLHEVEHFRQHHYQDKFYNKTLGGKPYFNLKRKLENLPQNVLIDKYKFGTNYWKGADETFANLSAYIQENMQKGIEFGDTPLAKDLGIKKGSKEMEYIYTHIIPGQDKIYQIPEEKTLFEYLKDIYK